MAAQKSTTKPDSNKHQNLEKHIQIINDVYDDLGFIIQHFDSMRSITSLLAEAGQHARDVVDVGDIGNGLEAILTQIEALVKHAEERLRPLTLVKA